ncbi:MAG: bifunctional metallophosphatase/5'-nucleotidase [Lentisphaerae bacterium]|nr:bifunctional metallophosphatase/5'-nucleotidase [Lentisphaerota bacterium]
MKATIRRRAKPAKLLLLALVGFCLALGSVGAGDVAVTVLYTADVHGSILPIEYYEGMEHAGGLLRCATVIRRERELDPELLLLDGGDLFQGSIESYQTRGQIVIQAVNALRYDALIPGNHEFDWGVANLRAFYAGTTIPVVAANIGADPPESRPPGKCVPFIVKTVRGVRVAIVGLTTPHIPRWSRPRLLGALTFQRSLEALQRVMPEVRQRKPDILILAAHQGFRDYGDDTANEINAIARSFPEFDLILGAHTHRNVETAELNGVLYSQPGPYGIWFDKIRLVYDPQARRILSKQCEIITVDASFKQDAELKKLLAAGLEEAEDMAEEDVGWADEKQTPTSEFPGQSSIQTLIAKSIAEAVPADVVFHGALTQADLRKGPIRVKDIWRIVPYENSIGVAHLTLDELRQILEENSAFYKSRGETRDFRGVHGLTYALNPKAPAGSKVSRLVLTHRPPPKEGGRIRVAFNSFDLASAGDRLKRLRAIVETPEARLEETDVDTRSAVKAYIEAHSPVREEPQEGAVIVRGKKGKRSKADDETAGER